MKICDYNHLILYAKKHYKRGDVIQDVRVILAERCGLEVEQVSDDDVWQMAHYALLKYSYKYIDQFLRELFKPMPDENDYGPLVWFSDTCPLVRAVRLVLIYLARVKVLDKDHNKILELGNPDPAILPLSELVKKRLEEATA